MRTSRLATTTAAFGIAIAAAAGSTFAPVAFAHESTVAAPSASTIDASRTGSIIINKLLNNASATYGDPTGNATDPAPTGTPLSGVTFTATRINGDITTNEGLAALAAMTPQQAAGNLSTDEFSGTTQNGTVTLDNLPLGAYLVQETITGTVTNDQGETVTGIVPAPAFIVFVPMTNPENTSEWNYNPVVYPKNTNLTSEKEVVDKDQNVGDTIDYTITTGIPAIQTGQTIDQYHVVDRYVASELSNMAVSKITLVKADGGTEDITDFTFGEATPLQDGSGRVEQVVNFGPTALAQLTANPGAQVKTDLTATISALGESGDGEIQNDALLRGITGNGDGTTTTFETPEDSVDTFIAKLRVNKINEDNQALSGATFQLYQSATCEADALDDLDPLTVNGADSWTTNDQGTFTIDGLHVTDFVNNEAATQDGYCLVETKAPEGYELLTDPVAVTFTKASMTPEEVFVPLHTEEITNIKSTSVKLPSTGGMGVGLIIALGALIIGGGLFAARRNSTTA